MPTNAYADEDKSPLDGLLNLFGISTQAEDGKWVVDPDTHDEWYSADGTGVSDQGGDSTKNTGRVWTDKSVYNSDVQLTSQGGEPTFSIENDEGTALVGLSALSSAANISGQTTINQPLDIILVLDSSGSMNNGYLTSYTYSAVYSPNEDWGDPTVYYVLNEDGTYSQIEERRSGGIFGNRDFDGWYLNNVRVYPKTSADDADTSHIQFYTREQSRVRIDIAMENAVTNFIDTVATENVGKEQTNQHRISIVNYAERANAYSTENWGDQSYFAYCTQGTNAQELKDYVTDLNYTGGTQADDGMALAEDIMNGTNNRGDGARTDAKRVVVFFTDGMPGDGDYVENSVAGPAVNTAYNMKQSGTSIYTVGVFQNADPDDLSGQGSTTHDANYFMNAVSSNYPNAQSTQTGQNVDFSDHCTLGDRAEGNYYFAADSAEGLNDVFNSIYDDFGSSATSPIKSETVIGGEDIGYLTFTDTLGDYMEVKNFKSIIFAGQKFTQVESQDNGTTTTYTFQGTVNNGNEEGEVYPGSHDLSTIEITVEHSSNIQDGDVVTVKIPSNLIPLRLYTAESETIDGETTTTTDVKDAYPIRVYYTVGLKADVMDGDNVDASKLDSSYIQSHTDENGNVYFYSNDYTSGDVGTTTAEFTPAETNSFYYFTENTPIYTAKNTDSPASTYKPGQTYYYQRTYYANNDVQTEWVSFVAGQGQLGNYVQYDQENRTYYIEEGSPRLTRASEFVADKADTSITNTAGKAISPSWSGSVVSVALGNNGKVAYPVSGSLQISKNVDWGTTGVTHNDKDFEYTVDLGGTGTQVEGNFDYIKYNAQGQPLDAQDQPQELDAGAQPAATGQISDGGKVSLSNGEHVVISNLPANTEFSVTEADAAGYTAANTVDGAQSQDGKVAEGTIVSNDTVVVAYTNTYSVQPTSLAEGSFHGTKVLTGRDWKDSESFTFTLKPAKETPNAPLPDGAEDEATVTLTNGGTNDYKDGAKVPFNFGEIEYKSADKYIYLIQETAGEEYGLAYSKAVYRVTVAVTDNGEGHLSAKIESVYNTFNDLGTSTGADESQWPVVEDGNALFTNKFAGEDIDYANIVGKKNYVNHTTGAGLVINQFKFTLTPVTAGAPMPDDNTMMNDGVGGIEFADIEFGIDDIGKTYEYKVTEVVPEGAADNGNDTATLNGMTYDTSEKTVSIGVTQDQETGSVIATVTGNGFEFNNSYQASSVTTNGAEDGLQITKKLDGAPGAEGQFKFTLAAANDDTKTAIASGWITGGSFAADNVETDDVNEAVTETVKTTSAIEKDGSENITFDNLTFTHPGKYSFNVTEAQNAPNDKWQYDTHTYSITYTVTDNNGQLEIADRDIAGESTFVNTYAVSMNYDDAAGGILFSKTLNGRTLEASQLDFTVTTSDDASAAKLTAATQTLSNRYGAADGATTLWRGIAGLTFDQDDVGQTFTFVVSETNEGADGYTYDDKPVTVEIEVNDEGGKLVTETTVTKQGEEAVVYNSNAFQQGVTSTYPTAAFVNYYSASDTDAVSVNFEKQLTGRNWKDTDHFEFTLTSDTTKSTVSADVLNAAYKGAEEDKTAEIEGSDVEKTFSFGTFQFSETGTYVYNVNEVQPEEGTDTQGIAYDKTTAVVTFTVTDPGIGKLAVESSIGGVKLTDDSAGIFENIYTYEPVSLEQNTDTGIGVKKTVTGAANTEDFSFTATFNAEASAKAAEDATVPVGELENITSGLTEGKTITTISENFDAGDTKNVDFGNITFNKPGVYVFDVAENNQKSDGGWTYDTNTYQITVTVEDNTEGELVAEVEGNDPEFINAYKPNEVSTDDPNGIGNIQVTKKVEGNATNAAFNFKLTLESGNEISVLTNADDPTSTFPVDGITKVTDGEFADGDTKTVDFGALTFTAAGDYTFKVVETDTAPANWTYASGDANAKTITIHVTDPENGGQLVASYDQDAVNNPTFTNSYKANGSLDGDAEAVKNLEVTKIIDGRKFQEGDTFTFQLTADGNNPVGATLPENAKGITIAYTDGDDATSKTTAFGDIAFTLPGTYTFYVSEVMPADADKLGGMTYSDEQYTVTVEVKDAQEGNGKLDASITEIVNNNDENAESLAFTNVYKPGGTTDLPASGEGSIQLQKVLIGKAWNGDEFTFQLKAESATADDGSKIETVPLPTDTEKTVSAKTGTESGNDYADFGFGSITYNQTGTYVYSVSEIKGKNGGITYDDHTATVTVSVVDNLHGGLTATASVEDGTFTNTYASELDYAEGGGLEIVKTFENATMRGFSFTVTPKDQASADKLGIDMAGETFTTKPGETVGDDNASHAEVAVLDAAAEAKFTQDDADDTYTYTVQETAGSEAGVTYDDTEYTVTIITADDGQGGIKVTTTVTDGADYNKSYVYDNDDATESQTAVVPFTNTYKATGELGGNGAVSINATKTLTNRPMVDGEFKFNVTNTNDPNEAVVATGTNDANGTINFSAINYSIDQMLKDVDNGLATPSVVEGKDTFTYTYKVTEDTDSLDDGVSAIDAAGFQLTVTVTDNGNGTLGIVVAYPDGGDGLTFRNTYGEDDQGKATLNINGTKTLDVQSGNNAPSIEGKYTFTLTGSEGAPMPATTEAHNDASGNVTFGDITFTMENVFGDTGVQEAAAADENAADVGNDEEAVDSEASGESGAVSNEADVDAQSATRTKEFTYTVTESGNVSGVDNDTETSKTFTVTVTDNGDGSLSVESNPVQGALFSFTNTYNVDPVESSPTGEGGITITKNLDGRNLNYGEFTFELIDQSGTVVATGTNDANGNVELGTVKFTEPGTSTYTIREAKGSLGGVDYDTVQYKATATVTDNGDGTLKVEWSFTDAQGNPLGENTGITFNNTYTAQPTSVSLGTGKLIEGRALAAGEFTFKLTDADGNEISTATNEENGAVTFDTITYDTPGDYTYTITEVAPQDTDPFTDGIQNNGVTYDESVYNATVKVTDNGKGNLTAQISYSTEDGTAPLFVNTYTPPAEPEQGTDDGGLFGMAKTGDFMGGMMAVIAAVIVAAAGGAAYAARKMRRPRGRHAR